MTPEAIARGLFLLAAFTLAGTAQTAWFVSKASSRFAVPLDGGLTLRGRRLLGDHKTLRGFVMMVPAAAAAFALLGAVAPREALWDLSVAAYAATGAVAGLGFMLGELPNSFLKRQLGVPPGDAPARAAAATAQFVGDRIDSGIGMLAALSLVLPVSWGTWAVVLVVGPGIHWSFSVLMFRLGLKTRPA